MYSVNKNESRLWTQVRKGNVDALSQLYRIHADVLYDYGIKLTGDEAIVMDCIHDLFLDIYKYRKTLGKKVNVKYYLLKSLKRKIIDQKHTKLLLIPPEEDFSGKHYRDLEDTIEEKIIRTEDEDHIRSGLRVALKALTSSQQTMIVMRFDQNKSYEEIAVDLNISIESARTNIYRSLKRLRKLLTCK